MQTTKILDSVTSRDGTRIAYERFGNGPPLVLVHGGISDHTYWNPVRATLAERFTVYAVERRGRGHSGDSDDYAIEREYEDVAAIVDSIGGPLTLLGHSYGAIVALEAALLTANVGTLLLYEPPLVPDGFEFPPGFVEALERMLAAGDRDGVIARMMTDVVGITAPELAELRLSPSWPALVGTAHTLPRELRSVQRYRFSPDRFRRLNLPTVLLEGEASPDELRLGVRLLSKVLPNSHLVTMPRVGHEAVETGPETLAAAILHGLEPPPQPSET